MKISAFMITLGRPHLVEESIGMFLQQTYPDRELFIYDTARQMPQVRGDRWRIVHLPRPDASLGTTVNRGIRMCEGGLIARWDDDDHYLPWHLEACVEALQRKPWAVPSLVWDQWTPAERILTRPIHARDHRHVCYAAAWSFRKAAFEAVGGYPTHKLTEEEIDFARNLFNKFGPPADTLSAKFPKASYMYTRGLSSEIHFSEVPDSERRRRQFVEYPKVTAVTPRLPAGYMEGFPENPVPCERKW